MFKVLILLVLVNVFAFSKDSIIIGNQAEPSSLDPHLVSDSASTNIVTNMFEGLFSIGKSGKVEKELVESYKFSKDEKTITFKLKKALWSDGVPVKASDFVYGFKRALDPKTGSNYSWYIKTMGIVGSDEVEKGKKAEFGLKAIDDYTLEMKLEKPISFIIEMLTYPTTFPVRQDIIEKYGKNWTKPKNIVVNGAYKLNEWVVNEKIVLQKNPKYKDAKDVKIKTATFLPITDSSVELQRFKSGDLDITNSIPSDAYSAIIKKHKDEVKTLPEVRVMYYVLNMDKVKAFKNEKVREALSLAVNRDILTSKVTRTGQLPAYNYVPQGLNGYTQYVTKMSQMSQKERESRAKELLKKAGYNKDNPLKFSLLYNTSDIHKKVALAVVSMWSKVFGKENIQVELLNQEWKTYLSSTDNKDFEAARGGWGADYYDAYSMLEIFTSFGYNYSTYKSKEYDDLLIKAKVTINKAKRNKIYADAEKLILDKHIAIPLYFEVKSKLVKDGIKGYPTSSPFGRIPVKFLYY